MALATTAYVALGANLGDRIGNLKSAVAALRAHPEIFVAAVSALYETAPIGGPEDQPAYVNAAVKIQTAIAAEPLLDALLDIERAHDRVRAERWGPRTLDLDILIYGDATVATERLTLPHPRMHERRFVLAPLADVAGEVRHPTLNTPIAALLAALLSGGDDDVTRISEDWT